MEEDGVQMKFNSVPTALTTSESGKVVVTIDKKGHGGDVSTLEVDAVLVATGREANVEGLNLEAAGVKLTKDGLIKVDKHLRTDNSKVYASGDCCSKVQFTHNSDAQSRMVIYNALLMQS